MGNTCTRDGKNHVFQIGSYTIKAKKVLARGGYGFVYLAQDFGKQLYALKIIGIQSGETRKVFQRQMEVMKIIGDHPNIVKVYAAQKKEQAGFILMQLAKTTLWQILNKTTKNPISESQSVYILRQITAGLRHIHMKGYAHRDIKTQNILVMNDGSVRICDFGSCTNQFMETDDIKTSKVSFYHKQFGKYTTYMYRPPQLVNFNLGYRIDQQMDMWMLGCIAYILAYYKTPFKGVQSAQQLSSISFPQNPRVSQALQSFILKLLKTDPCARMTSEEALNFLNEKFDLSKVNPSN